MIRFLVQLKHSLSISSEGKQLLMRPHMSTKRQVTIGQAGLNSNNFLGFSSSKFGKKIVAKQFLLSEVVCHCNAGNTGGQYLTKVNSNVHSAVILSPRTVLFGNTAIFQPDKDLRSSTNV